MSNISAPSSPSPWHLKGLHITQTSSKCILTMDCLTPRKYKNRTNITSTFWVDYFITYIFKKVPLNRTSYSELGYRSLITIQRERVRERAEKPQGKNVRIMAPLIGSRNNRALKQTFHFAIQRIYTVFVSQPPTQHYVLVFLSWTLSDTGSKCLFCH